MPFTPPTQYASQANTGGQSTIEIGDSSSPPTYTALLEVKNFTIGGSTMSQIDVTHLLSPGNVGERIPGRLQPGTISITGNFIGDATQLSIATAIAGRSEFPVRIKGPVQRLAKTLTVTGTGFFGKFDIGPFDSDKAIDYSADINLTGTSTYAVA